jgi:hypothetical protein
LHREKYGNPDLNDRKVFDTSMIKSFWNGFNQFFEDSSIYPIRSQSYDRELQRQRCKFLQRHG